MAKKNFYAVKVGNGGPAIYASWAECEAQVKGFQGAIFKGFTTRAEAEGFLGNSSSVQGSAAAAVPVAKKSKSNDGASTSGSRNAFSALMSAGQAKLGVAAGEIAVFTDGACAGNQNVAVTANPAGWGAVVVEGCLGDPPVGGHAVAELFGPVDLDSSSAHFLGAEVGSNNTGELSAVCEALRWLTEHDTSSRPAVICFDSMYAANQAQGIHKAHKNVALSKRSHVMLAAARRKRTVRFQHVKGHSGHMWNDTADTLANRGATGARSAVGGDQVLPAAPGAALSSAGPGVRVGTGSPSRKRPVDE